MSKIGIAKIRPAKIGPVKISPSKNGLAKIGPPVLAAPSRAGMGIGVYQSRDFIRKPGSDLIVTSQLGYGSEFLMTIPLGKKLQLV